ncbi:alkaline-phosphatase-like protein [Aspergillus alliaceus]|uniref:Alkaline-phosphatase-like protein n=1 Tax=Petromyces alliaceus TaxID=209559 RepID=A0A5N7BVY1_PETAA|nr:alkaline-phosphatase-like protein [Aspergillus alliaceus]KAB8229810.1 alkaline-phosphatase-like protein [Aspergillus alliaceus]KAE8385991.1 alkaline-phosphatase-like protein [Aspergillus alliaceus]
MATKKPNILYIMADQMAAPLLAFHDKDSPIKTPNLNRLAEEGVVFDSAYCNSPLCAPSRFVMVTGQLPSKIGAYDNAADLPADIPTYAHYLRREGYHTALAGKMHFCGPDQLHGYEQRLTSDIYPGDYGWSVNWDEPDIRPDWYHNMSSVMEAGPVVRTNQLDFDEEVMYKSTQYLYNHVRQRTDQPFCLTVSLTHPHDPYAMTKEFWDLYEGVDIPLPKNGAIPQDQQDPHSQRVMKCIDLWGKEMPEERIKAARRAYYAACTYVDTNVGKLLKVLDDCGLTEDTIVVFTGDHGDMLGERGLWYKMVWYENSARVPMIMHAPKRFAPKRISQNVSTMDLLPTFVDLVGAQLIQELPMDGVSLLPYLTGEDGLKTDTVLGEYMAEGTQSPVVMIRRGRWKFVYSLIDPPMLFDVEADPEEKVNLAAGLVVPAQVVATKPTAGSQLQPASLPTPADSPRVSPRPQRGASSAYPFPSPPRTPSPGKGLPSMPTTTEPAKILAYFMEEAQARWDLESITEDVLRSQRRRRLVYSALIKGNPAIWDYEPRIDPSTQYVRNQGKGALDDVELISRWPRVLQQAANVMGTKV